MSQVTHVYFNSAGNVLEKLCERLGHDEGLQERVQKIRSDLDALHHDYTEKEQEYGE